MPNTLLQIEYTNTFCVEASFGVDLDDGRNRLHIISFAPNVDIDQLMAAASENFAAAGDPPFPADAASQIKAFAAPYRTQAIIF